MAELTPVPFGALVTRMFTELQRSKAIFDLPARSFVTGTGGRDYGTTIHGHRASTPFGPAAGPHTQLAQNIVLAFLAGARVMELKTVQVKDDLVIPRPCIDMQTIGYNVEWSQELRLAQSREEYVKAAMLIEMLKASGLVPGLDAPGFGDTVYDMSVGYDLAGIRTPGVRAFIAGLKDASELVARYRAELPAAYAHLRDLPYPTRLSDTLTLSTFHGCPPEEIEAIADHLLREEGLHVIVKLNPTLLGKAALRDLLHRRLGYADLHVPDEAFDKDATWDHVQGFVERLSATAARVGRGFGVKFTNTLVVENHRPFFPKTEKWMYLSGPPLHVLAMTLVGQFRERFGDRFPISFSAGIDAQNFPDGAALGLKPVSVCTDLLRPGGYGRGKKYLDELGKRMDAVKAKDLDTFALLAYGQAEAALDLAALPADVSAACRAALAAGGDLRAAAGPHLAAWVSAARLLGTARYVARLPDDPRYALPKNATPPKKVGSKLELFDCLTCDKCIPVCPNDANFSVVIPPQEVPVQRLTLAGGRFTAEVTGSLKLEKPRQIANYADACNECGHCDVMCPEDGGPYAVKPRFFGSEATWRASPTHDGFALERTAGGVRMLGRFSGQAFEVVSGGPRLAYRGEGFDLTLDLADPAGTAQGTASGPVDLTWLRIMELLRAAVTAPDQANYVSAALEAQSP